jgi:predicted RNase H-like nuclease (RuvC/YqgF family)
MPESVRPEPDVVDQVLESLESSVGALVERFKEVAARLQQMESEHSKLKNTLESSDLDSLDAEQFERRLTDLADDNKQLRQVIKEARERAQRIRRRLIVLEDEV